MRYIIIVLWLVLLGLGCSENRIQRSIPGSYVKQTESSYGKAWDTLRISVLKGKSYRVERSIGYQSVLDGRLLEKKYKRSRWQSELDLDRGELQDKAFGHVLRLSPERNGLDMGGLWFHKIK